MAKFDDTNWTIYNTSNSSLPTNFLNCISIDAPGNKWIGTLNGLVKFDDTNWTIYNTSNSGLLTNDIYGIAIDAQGNKWIGTGNGLFIFDDTNWTSYNTSNSGLPDNTVARITIDSQGNKWIATLSGGLAKFDNTNWTVFNTTNSALPGNTIHDITIDSQNNKWIATDNGIGIFNENGNVVFVENNKFSSTDVTFVVYPNPSSGNIFITNTAHIKSIFELYDLQGRNLISKYILPGEYVDLHFLESGIYFYSIKTESKAYSGKLVKN